MYYANVHIISRTTGAKQGLFVLSGLNYSAIPKFCVEGLPKILDFGYFVLIWWETNEKQELPMVWLIIGSDNISTYNVEVNGAFAMHVIVHNTHAKSE